MIGKDRYDEMLIKVFYAKTRMRSTVIGKLESNSEKYSNIVMHLMHRYNEFFDFRDTLYRIKNRLEEPNRCKHCGKALAYSVYELNNFCSQECKIEHAKIVREETMIERFGTKGICSLPEYREKMIAHTDYAARNAKTEQTCMERYGRKNPWSSPEIRAKGEATRKQREADALVPKGHVSEYLKSIEIYPLTNKAYDNLILKTLFTKRGIEQWKFKQLEIKFPNIVEYLKNRFEDSDSLMETLDRIRKGIEVKPKCPGCGKPVKYIGKATNMFQKYCNVHCKKNDPEYVRIVSEHSKAQMEREKEINRKLYNCDYRMQSDEFKNKRAQTLMDRYDTTNVYEAHKMIESKKND